MEFTRDFVNNKGVNIHYIDNNIKNSNNTTLLICPGLSETAEDYINLMSSIKDRRCVALSFRGRGCSDIPENGYGLIDHIKDIQSVVNHLGLDRFCIMGISRGVSYELGYAIKHYSSLKGIIIGEYPPVHKQMPKGWAKESMDFYNEYCESISITYEVLKSIEDESTQVNFNNNLKDIKCPTLILKGELEESLLSNEDIVDYVNNLGSRSIRIEKFAKVGHNLITEDFDGLVNVINSFLLNVDKS
ncbi:MAG: alpha/beta fold hydrolase [Peptostreptococcaceae bacterium]